MRCKCLSISDLRTFARRHPRSASSRGTTVAKGTSTRCARSRRHSQRHHTSILPGVENLEYCTPGRDCGRQHVQIERARSELQRISLRLDVRGERLLRQGDEGASAQERLQAAPADHSDGRAARRQSGRLRGLGDEGLGHRERGHALRPRVLPADRADCRKARQFLVAHRRRRSAGGVFRQRTDPRRAGRLELSLGRHSGHVRSPRLHGLGPDQPGLHFGKPQRYDAVHSHGLLLVDRRGARQENARAALDASAEQAGPAHPEAIRP